MTDLWWIIVVISIVSLTKLCSSTPQECTTTCESVALTTSVVTLETVVEDGQYKPVIKTAASEILVRIVVSWSGNDVTVSLENNAGEFSHSSMPHREDKTFYISIAIVDDELEVFLDGFPAATWTIVSLTSLSDEQRDLLSGVVNVDFTAITTSHTAYHSDRCQAGFQMFSDLDDCTQCMDEVPKGDGGCVDVNKSLLECGLKCSVNGFCPSHEVSTKFGKYTWTQTVVSNQELTLPCKYDADGKSVSLMCESNNNWSDLDISACLKTAITDQLLNYLNTDLDDYHPLVDLLDGVADLADFDLLVLYDIINKISNRGEGEVNYTTAMTVVGVLNQISLKSVCQKNPICFWITELMREVAPRLQNETVLMLAGSIGMFSASQESDKLTINTFCTNTFRDKISGCDQDGGTFLEVMQNEVARLVDGTSTTSMKLSLLFSDDFTFYQSSETVTPETFKTTVKDGSDPVGLHSVASFIVDTQVWGLPSNTKTYLHFNLHPNSVYTSRGRVFVWGESTFSIIYECGFFTSNYTRDYYLQKIEKSWSNDTSLIHDLIDTSEIEKSKSMMLGTWISDGCSTDYNIFSDSPSIACTCDKHSEAFTVLAHVREKKFSENYVEILISLTGLSFLGIIVGVTIILLPAKVMGIPKAVKMNISIVLLLLVIALYFLITKMAYELRYYKFS